MPYKFVANLKPGKFTPLDKQWLKNLNGILKMAKSNNIKQIRPVRLSKTNYFGNCSVASGIPMKMSYMKLSFTSIDHVFLSILIKCMI
jgi:hypothetical protein